MGNIFVSNFIQQRRALLHFRDRLNPLEKYDEVEIKMLFRFERVKILEITNDLRFVIEHRTGRNKALSSLHQVCIFLRFVATGCMQTSVATWINVDKSTISRTIWRVARGIPEVYNEQFRINVNSSRDGFLRKFGLPNIIEAIDCTHVKILAPPTNLHPDEYINRKNFHSINVQVICDSNCVVTDLFASWPGSVHDSRILKNSDIFGHLMKGEIMGILQGDNGYGVQPMWLVPFLHPSTPAEEHYNVIIKYSMLQCGHCVFTLMVNGNQQLTTNVDKDKDPPPLTHIHTNTHNPPITPPRLPLQ